MSENHMVRCVRKDGDTITQIGGQNSDGKSWSMSDRDAIAGIKSGKFKFYVAGEGRGIWLVVQQKNGRDVLETEGDPALLRALPNCG